MNDRPYTRLDQFFRRAHEAWAEVHWRKWNAEVRR